MFENGCVPVCLCVCVCVHRMAVAVSVARAPEPFGKRTKIVSLHPYILIRNCTPCTLSIAQAPRLITNIRDVPALPSGVETRVLKPGMYGSAPLSKKGFPNAVRIMPGAVGVLCCVHCCGECVCV